MARGAGEVAPLMLVGVVKLAPELPVDGIFPFVHLERSFMHLGFHIYDVGFQSRNSEAGKPMVYMTTLLLIALICAHEHDGDPAARPAEAALRRRAVLAGPRSQDRMTVQSAGADEGTAYHVVDGRARPLPSTIREVLALVRRQARALTDVTLRRAAGPGDGADRPVGLRQVHACCAR